MIPDNEWAYPGSPGNFQEPDSKISTIQLFFYTRGPTQFGLPVNADWDEWRCYVEDTNDHIILRNNVTAELVDMLFEVEDDADDLSAAFTRDGTPVIAQSYQDGPVHKIKVTTGPPGGGTDLILPYSYHPWLVLDEWRSTILAGDVCLFYVKNDNLFLRYSSENFATSYWVGRFDGATSLGPIGVNDVGYMQVQVNYGTKYKPRWLLACD